ncbi:MAG: SDR family oxidoreductase [Actinobacteria bacterium]|nr:SDR family oxidoreductase [Actinomycetota bacterium]
MDDNSTKRPLDLTGRTVLVTGGNGGIGLGMAHACAQHGARIVLWGRNSTKNSTALASLSEAGIDALALVCDVADESAVEAAFAESVEWAGRIDTVFANAGVGGPGVPFTEMTLDQWRQVMAVNLDGVFITFRAAARHMIEHGGGALVAISSTSAIHGAAGNEAYGSSKTALLGLTRALAVAMARHNIRVNALLPGWVRTEMTDAGYTYEKFRDNTTKRTPLRRWAEPADMGPAAVFLADPDAMYHTGQHVTVDGGYTIF